MPNPEGYNQYKRKGGGPSELSAADAERLYRPNASGYYPDAKGVYNRAAPLGYVLKNSGSMDWSVKAESGGFRKLTSQDTAKAREAKKYLDTKGADLARDFQKAMGLPRKYNRFGKS